MAILHFIRFVYIFHSFFKAGIKPECFERPGEDTTHLMLFALES